MASDHWSNRSGCRADEIYSGQSILGDIWQSIQSAEIIVADLTGKNPNVMYELGLVHALWKRLILLSQNKDDVPFDLRAWRVIWYDFTFAGATRLKDELKRAIEAMRAESDVESDLVPWKESKAAPPPQPNRPGAPGPVPPPNAAVGWLVGEVTSLKDAGYGFVDADGENFFLHFNDVVADVDAVKPGGKVMFVPKDDGKGRGRRASKVFTVGGRARGRLNRVIRGKGYGFADVPGYRGEITNLFVYLGNDEDFSEGDLVDFTIEASSKGPSGREVSRAADRAPATGQPPSGAAPPERAGN